MGSVIKATPIQFIDSKSRIKKWRGYKTALSDYYACLSRGLLLMALGADTHTHTQIYQRPQTKRFQETRHARAAGPHAPGLKTYSIVKVHVTRFKKSDLNRTV